MGKIEGRPPIMQNSDQSTDSWEEISSESSSDEYEIISDSTGGLDDEGEDIFSEEDRNSSSESLYIESSSASIIEVPTATQQQQQHRRRQSEASSSSSFKSMDFDSSSSSSSFSGSQPLSSPQHERGADGSSRQESGSAKLKRILYGPGSSSFSDDSDDLSSSSDSSSSSTYGKFDEDDIILREKDQMNSIAEVNVGGVLEPVDEKNERSEETTNPITSSANEDSSLDIFDDESDNDDSEESLSSEAQIDSGDIESNEDSASSSVQSDIQSKSHRENDDGKDLSSHGDGTVSGKSNESHNSSRNSENAYAQVALRKAEIDRKERDDNNTSQEIAPVAIPRKSPMIVQFADESSSTKTENELQPQESTIWIGSEDMKASEKNGSNNIKRDKVGWKPPALTTFSPSNSKKARNAYHQKEKFPKPRTAAARLRYNKNGTSTGEKITKERKRRTKEKKSPPPILLEIIVSPPSDDESTLGTVGTYFERFPEWRNEEKKKKSKKNKKNKKNKEKSTLEKTIPNSETSKKMTNSVENQKSMNRNFDDVEENDTSIPDQLDEDPFGFLEKTESRKHDSKLIESKCLDDPEVPLQEPSETTENKISKHTVSEFKDSNGSHMSAMADPPGDTYLHSYDHCDEKEPLLPSSKSTPPDSVNHVDITWKALEPSSSFGYSIYSSRMTPRYVLKSDSPMSTWVPTGTNGTGEKLEIDPTRAFINSLIGKKRSTILEKSRVTEHEYSNPQASFVDISETSSKNISEPGEMPLSEGSSPQSYALNLFGGSSLPMNEAGQLAGRKGPVNISQLQSSAESTSSSGSKTPTSSIVVEPAKRSLQRRASTSRLIDPQKIQDGASHSSNSGSSPSSSRPSKPVGRSRGLPRRRASVSQLIDKSDKSGSSAESSKSSKKVGVGRAKRMPQRRGSVSRLLQFGSNISEDSGPSTSSRSSKQGGGERKKKMLQRRGSVSRLIQFGSNNFEDSGSSSSSRSSEKGSEKRLKRMPQRRGSMSRLIQHGSNNSYHSGSSTRPSNVVGRFTKGNGQGLSWMRNKITLNILMWSSSIILVITTIIVIIVLWQRGSLSNPIDGNSGNSTNSLPTLKPTPSLMPSTESSNNIPSFAPAKIDSPIDLYSLIIEAYPLSQKAFEDPNSPQSKALNWLQSSANSGISESRRFLQRYALATVYYSTNGDDWIDNSGWLSEENECNWMSKAKEPVCGGQGDYITLDLQENNLNGTLPVELGILSDTIRTVITRKNLLSGEIPSSIIADMKGLKVLDLSSNEYSGALDQELFKATNLTRLSLFENKFSSSIPTEIGQLTKLDVLDLGSNELTSTIPPTINKLSKLAGLSLFGNRLTGTVPTELSGMKSLEILYIDSNSLEAPVPIQVCDLDIDDFWGDCEKIQCTCCTTCCDKTFGCFDV